MSNISEKIINYSLEWGIKAVQAALSNPIVGPLLLKSIQQIMNLRNQIENSREDILKKLQLASYQEQKDLRRQLRSMERKLERLERRLRELQTLQHDTSPPTQHPTPPDALQPPTNTEQTQHTESDPAYTEQKY